MSIGSYDQDGPHSASETPDTFAAAGQDDAFVESSSTVTTVTAPATTINDHEDNEIKDEMRAARSETARHESPEYDPNDARTMSPRRNSAETEKLAAATRAAVQE